MTTTIERNNQTHLFIIFLLRLCYKIYTKNFTNNEQKQGKHEVQILEMNFIFPLFIEVWMQWDLCKVNMTPFWHHLFCTRPIAFILRQTTEKWILFLKEILLTTGSNSLFRSPPSQTAPPIDTCLTLRVNWDLILPCDNRVNSLVRSPPSQTTPPTDTCSTLRVNWDFIDELVLP